MRFYNVLITNSTGALIRQFTSLFPDGSNNMSALTVEVDIPLYALASPMNSSFLRVWGIGITEISQASNYNGMNIQIFAGMSKGLPLANPDQAGLILEGTIQQAFGNWQGTDQSLDFIVNVSSGTNSAPANIVINWKAGDTLANAVKNTLATAFPAYKAVINIDSRLVLPNTAVGYYATLSQFANYIKQVSQQIIGPSYSGVSIVIKDSSFYVYDGSTTGNPKQLNFVDLMGQPTWIDAATINVRCVLRADINVGDYIKMPAGAIVVTQASSYSQYRAASVFQGTFQVIRVRMIGNSRQPDGNSWVVSIDAVTAGS